MKESLEKVYVRKKEQPNSPLERVWFLLEEFKKILNELGLNVTDRLFHKHIFFDEGAEAGIPVVSDGLDGIRVSFRRRHFENHGMTKDGFRNLNLWFTNGFKNPKNEIRLIVQSRWDDLMKKYFPE